MSTLEDFFAELESASRPRKLWWRVSGIWHRLPGLGEPITTHYYCHGGRRGE